MTAESIDTTVFLRKSYNNIRTKRKSTIYGAFSFGYKIEEKQPCRGCTQEINAR